MTVHASSLSIALLVEVILVLLQPFCDSETKKKKKKRNSPQAQLTLLKQLTQKQQKLTSRFN